MLLKALHCDQNELQNSELAYARFFVVSIRSRKLYFLYNFSIFSSKASSLRSINVQGFTVNNDENSIIYLQTFCESKAGDSVLSGFSKRSRSNYIRSRPKTFEDVPTLRTFPGPSLKMYFGKHNFVASTFSF